MTGGRGLPAPGSAPQKCQRERLQPELGLIAWSGQARLGMADGSMCEARGTRIVWSEANAHLYRAKQAGWTDDYVALAEAEVDGWQTYNFEVEELDWEFLASVTAN